MTNADKSTSSDSRMNGKMDTQQILLDRMELLCGSVQDLRKEMKDGFAAEAVKRQVDNNRLREQLSKSFEAEQCQIRKEMAMGFKKEEDARKQVQDYLEMVKEQILQLKKGSGSTVCSEASTTIGSGGSGTFARPPCAIAARYQSHFIPRRMEFKGWITDFQQCSLQVIAMEEIKDFIDDLEEMIPESSHKYIDWEQTKSEQGHWPTKNTVSMWFKSDMNLVVMIDLLRKVKEELKKKHNTIKQREVVARLESSPQQKPFNRAHAVFFNALNAMKGMKNKSTCIVASSRSVSS